MKTLRLLLWEKCDRSCVGCCNKQKQFDLENLPYVTNGELATCEEIVLTGGEPLLYPSTLERQINKIRSVSFAAIYVYTAKTADYSALLRILYLTDGITVTLHEQKDVEYFIRFNNFLMLNFEPGSKSLRLNIFNEVKFEKYQKENLNNFWKVKDNIVWIENCPLPENETFKRILIT